MNLDLREQVQINNIAREQALCTPGCTVISRTLIAILVRARVRAMLLILISVTIQRRSIACKQAPTGGGVELDLREQV